MKDHVMKKVLSSLSLPLVLGAIPGLILAAPGCSKLDKQDREAQVTPNDEGPTYVNGTVGVKTVAQISVAMSKATGIPVTDVDVAKQTDSGKTLLSPDGSALTVTAPMVLAYTAIGGMYCEKLIQKESAITDANASQRKFFTAVKFEKGTAQFTAAVRKDILFKMSSAFSSGDQPTDEEMKFYEDAVADAAPSSASAPPVKELVKMLCTAVLASPKNFVI